MPITACLRWSVGSVWHHPLSVAPARSTRFPWADRTSCRRSAILSSSTLGASSSSPQICENFSDIDQPYDSSDMEISSLRAAAESAKHFTDHKRPARKGPTGKMACFRPNLVHDHRWIGSFLISLES
jgi:hypothetical protein